MRVKDNKGFKKDSFTVLFAGAYGIRNAGDDLPLVTMCEELRAQAPDCIFEFRVLSRHPDPWEAEAYGVTMIQNLEYSSRDEAKGRWFRGLNPGDDQRPFEIVKEEIRNCDLLVLGAGNALLDLTIDFLSGPIPLMSVYGFLAKLYHCPVMMYGMSIGPLHSDWGKDLTRGLLESATIVTVRDSASAKLAHELLSIPRQIHQLPDATLMAEPVRPVHVLEVLQKENIELPDRPVIALGLRDLTGPCDAETGRQLVAAVVGLMNQMKDDVTFLFIPQSIYEWDDDRVLAERIIENAPSGTSCFVVQGRHHPFELSALYGIAQVTVAVRLHAAVFSAMAGTPVVAVNYLPKVKGFMETIKSDAYCLDLSLLTADRLAESVQRLINKRGKLSESIESEVMKLRKDARQYATLALTKGLGLLP